MVRELPASKSDSALSSSARRPTTSTPERETELRNGASTSDRIQPSPSANFDDFLPVEVVPSVHEDANRDDETFRLIEESEFKIPSPKKIRRTRKSRREQGESSRRLRSSAREGVYSNSEYSDDDYKPTRGWNQQREEAEHLYDPYWD